MTIGTARPSIDPVKLIAGVVENYLEHTRTPGVCVAVYYPPHFGESGMVLPYGAARLDPYSNVTADTIFGIGSVTKVFTSLLLAHAVNQGNVKLKDLAITYLSKQYGVKGSDAFNAIQLRNLATHTSGLPDEAAGIGAIGDQLFSDEGPSNPLIGYWNNYIGAFVPACWQYSNTAFVTLGFALTEMYPGRTGNQYNQLLRDLITGPLSMKHTSAHPDASLFATGYTRHRDEQKPATEVAADLKSQGPTS